eukprot:scaffold558769_cov20-Prasinocladus_malaysianus.AAC.1
MGELQPQIECSITQCSPLDSSPTNVHYGTVRRNHTGNPLARRMNGGIVLVPYYMLRSNRARKGCIKSRVQSISYMLYALYISAPHSKTKVPRSLRAISK